MSEIFDELKEISKNKYCIGEVIGSGAFCKVYNCSINNDKVIKVLDNKYKSEFKREINVFNKIQKHKLEFLENNVESNILFLHEYYVTEYNTYIIFEKMDIDLYNFSVKFMRKFKSRLPINVIKKIIISISNGILELNFNNLIHADLKLDNIMIKICDSSVQNIDHLLNLYKKKGELFLLNSIQIKLIDLNKTVFINDVFKPLNIQTLNYQSPEIILGNRNYNEKIDIWSIGAIIWFLITGREFIDIYNNKYNMNEFKYYDYSTIKSNSSYGSYYSYREINKLENYIQLNKLSFLLGHMKEKDIVGVNIDEYFKDNQLIGFSSENPIVKIETELSKEIKFFKLDEINNVETFIYNVSTLLEKYIFLYDFNARIDIYNLIKFIM